MLGTARAPSYLVMSTMALGVAYALQFAARFGQPSRQLGPVHKRQLHVLPPPTAPRPTPAALVSRISELLRRRCPSQSRVLGSSVLVGIVAGLGAMVFAVACQLVVPSRSRNGRLSRGRPRRRSDVAWLPETETPFRPWLLLIVPTLGGLLSGLIVFTFAPEAEGTAPTRPSPPITTSKARSGRGCRW